MTKMLPFENFENNLFMALGYTRTGNTFIYDHIIPRYYQDDVVRIPFITRFFQQEDEMRKGRDYLRTKIIQYLETHNYDGIKPIVVSAYSLSHTADYTADNYNLPNQIFEFLPGCKVLFRIRSQFSIIPSHYSRGYVKGGGSWPYEVFLKANVLATNRFDYYEMIKKALALFGENKVSVLMYEDLVENEDVFLRQLFVFYGLPFKWDVGAMKTKAPRYPPLITEGCRRVNALLETAPARMFLRGCYPNSGVETKIRIALRKVLYRINGLNNRLHLMSPPELEENKKFRSMINDHYRVSNRKLFDLIGRDPARYDYPA
jgi:hypothetical protein